MFANCKFDKKTRAPCRLRIQNVKLGRDRQFHFGNLFLAVTIKKRQIIKKTKSKKAGKMHKCITKPEMVGYFNETNIKSHHFASIQFNNIFQLIHHHHQSIFSSFQQIRRRFNYIRNNLSVPVRQTNMEKDMSAPKCMWLYVEYV